MVDDFTFSNITFLKTVKKSKTLADAYAGNKV
jgi:hypothetical protein